MSETIDTTVGTFEPERVDYQAWPKPVQRAFIVAISKDDGPDGDFFVDNERDGTSVLLVINGRPFSFEYLIRRLNAQLDEEINRAARLLVEERAERIAKVLQRELDDLFPLAKRDEDGY